MLSDLTESRLENLQSTASSARFSPSSLASALLSASTRVRRLSVGQRWRMCCNCRLSIISRSILQFSPHLCMILIAIGSSTPRTNNRLSDLCTYSRMTKVSALGRWCFQSPNRIFKRFPGVRCGDHHRPAQWKFLVRDRCMQWSCA